MVARYQFLWGFLVAMILVGCAGWSIRYYGLEGVSYEHGKLTGPKESDDRNFSDCQPDGEFKKGRCVVMFYTEFDALKKDYQKCYIDLNECQRYRNSP